MLKHRVAIITGAARGIGQSMALHFSRLGASVVAADRLDCEETVRQIGNASGEAIGVIGDVTSARDASTIVEASIAEF